MINISRLWGALPANHCHHNETLTRPLDSRRAADRPVCPRPAASNAGKRFFHHSHFNEL